MATNILIYLPIDEQKQILTDLAAALGFINRKGDASVSTMLQAIADGEAVVAKVEPSA